MIKKGSRILISLFVIVILVSCGNTVDSEKTELYSNKAEEAIQLLNSGERDKLKEQFDDEMKEAMTDDNFAIVEDAIKEAGNFEKIEKSSVSQKNEVYSAVTIAKYSNKKRVFTINYNSDEQIVGLFIK